MKGIVRTNPSCKFSRCISSSQRHFLRVYIWKWLLLYQAQLLLPTYQVPEASNHTQIFRKALSSKNKASHSIPRSPPPHQWSNAHFQHITGIPGNRLGMERTAWSLGLQLNTVLLWWCVRNHHHFCFFPKALLRRLRGTGKTEYFIQIQHATVGQQGNILVLLVLLFSWPVTNATCHPHKHFGSRLGLIGGFSLRQWCQLSLPNLHIH